MAYWWRKSIARGRTGFTVGAAGLGMLAVLWASPAARADEPPQILTGPSIAGVSQEGQTLTATATYTGTPTPTASWTWLRCPEKGGSCTVILEATLSSYTLTAADVGFRIRVRLTVRNSVGENEARSEPTDVVSADNTVQEKPSREGTRGRVHAADACTCKAAVARVNATRRQASRFDCFSRSAQASSTAIRKSSMSSRVKSSRAPRPAAAVRTTDR